MLLYFRKLILNEVDKMNALIIYYSLTGMTLKAAKYIMDGLREKDIIVDLKSVKQIDENTKLDYDYIHRATRATPPF